MGGDGGTLNNSRTDHVRMRRQVLGAASTARASSRASVTHCALSKQPLHPPHVVVDHAGNLYNKEALLRYVLSRRSRKHSPEFDALAHVRSVKRDTRAVVCTLEDGLVCPVTRKAVAEGGRFGVGWECGCVTARVSVQGVGSDAEVEGDEVCVACEKAGWRVRLGLSLEERGRVLEERRWEKGLKGKRKGRDKGVGVENDVLTQRKNKSARLALLPGTPRDTQSATSG